MYKGPEAGKSSQSICVSSNVLRTAPEFALRKKLKLKHKVSAFPAAISRVSGFPLVPRKGSHGCGKFLHQALGCQALSFGS